MERARTPVVVGGAVAIAAVLLSSIGSKSPPSKQSLQSTGRPPAASEQVTSSSGESATSEALSRDDRGPWYALCQEFAGDREAPDAHRSTEQVEEVERTVKDEKSEHKFTVRKPVADDLGTCRGEFSDFRFLVATVPDPVASHLDIEFDRAIESLQRAAAFEGYSFERYWLPWRAQNAGGIYANASATALRSEERLRQEQPGLLIFRRLLKPVVPKSEDTAPGRPKALIQDSCYQGAENQDQRLLIFLVGETPTAGLNRTAFFKSLDYIDQLRLPSGASPSATQPRAPLCIPIAGP